MTVIYSIDIILKYLILYLSIKLFTVQKSLQIIQLYCSRQQRYPAKAESILESILEVLFPEKRCCESKSTVPEKKSQAHFLLKVKRIFPGTVLPKCILEVLFPEKCCRE